MPRIETKWFHEIPSPLFNLVAVDHTVREDYSDMVNSEGRGYVTVGLFRLAKTVSSGGIGGIPGVGSGEGEDIYSLDVGSSDVQRTQLEVRPLLVILLFSFSYISFYMSLNYAGAE